MTEHFGNYVLLRRLGAGGMAEVFLARAKSTGGFEKLLAIKRLLPPYNTDKQIISMLADEARVSVWLNHPNIVQVFDFGRVGSTYFIALEFVDGCDLCELIRPPGQPGGRPLPLATALYIMTQVADALDYAHRRRNQDGELLEIIHRDVSPHNVLISREGQVKLADFGLARASISVHRSRAGIVRGKFSYMPKEQARGLAIDHRIDIFAAGVTLYETLTGVKPYTSTTLAHQLYQLEQPVPPPSMHRPDLPVEVDDITMQAMSPDPETRYSTAESLAGDLRDLLDQHSTFNQEEERLAALVRAAAPSVPDPLPAMALGEAPISDGSLIEEELRVWIASVQSKRPAVTEPEVRAASTRVPISEQPPSPRPEIEGHATEAVSEKDLDEARTIALPAPSASTLATRAVGPSSTPAPPVARFEVPHPQHGGNGPPGSLVAPEPAALRNPRDTMEEMRPAGDLSGDTLDNAQTTHRASDDARIAFRRALDEREKRRQAAHRRGGGAGPVVLRQRDILVLALLGLALFGAGIVVGWVLHRPAATSAVVLQGDPGSCPCRDGGSAVAPGSAPEVPRSPGLPGTTDHGYLTVTTNAPAKVYVDDASSGLTAPLVRLALPPGIHRVKVYSERQRTFSEPQPIVIRSGITSTLSFTLE